MCVYIYLPFTGFLYERARKASLCHVGQHAVGFSVKCCAITFGLRHQHTISIYNIHIHTHTQICVHIYIQYVYICKI